MKHFNLLDISIYQIRLFLAVAEERNFTVAATRMNITQPALTKRIQNIEDAIGLPLINRTKRPIELTEAGIVLFESWMSLVQKFDFSVDTVRKSYGHSIAKLIVSMPDSGRPMPWLQSAGRHLQEKYEEMNFAWEYTSFAKWKSRLNTYAVDLMIMLRIEELYYDEDWQHIRLMDVPKLVCMLKTNPLARKESITYEDLREQRFLIQSPSIMPSHIRFVREHVRKQGGFDPIIARFIDNTHGMIGSLDSDDEVAVCDMFLRDTDSPHIKCFKLPDTYSGLDAVWRKDNLNPYLSEFIAILQKELAKEYSTLFPK
jgi:DNA-binding transcriptional LysR family regulator